MMHKNPSTPAKVDNLNDDSNKKYLKAIISIKLKLYSS